MRLRRRAAVLCALTVLGAGLATATPAHAVTDIRIGVNPIGTNAIAVYAQEKGYFGRNGLSAKPQVFPAPPQALNALAAGQVQFVYSPIASVLPAYTNGGMPLKIVAGADGFSAAEAARAKADKTYAGIVDPSSICAATAITRPRDLVGKKVGVGSRGGHAELAVSTAVRKDGGDPKTIKFAVIGMQQAVATVKNGLIDAAYLSTPYTGQCVNEGLNVVSNPGLSIVPKGGPISVWVTSEKYAASHPSVVKAFQKSIYEANRSTHGHPANRRAVQIAGTQLTKMPQELALAEYPRYQFTAITAHDVQQIADAMQRAGLVSKPVDVAGIMAPQYRP